MAIAIGQSVKSITGFGTEANPQSTAGVTTVTKGSTIVVAMVWVDDKTFVSFADTIGGSPSGNTWTQLGAEIDSGTGTGDGGRMRIYYCQNANGGATHVFTLTTSGLHFGSIWVAEITGANAVSFDKSAGLVLDATSPINSGSTATTTLPAELLIGISLGNNDSGTGAASIVSSGSSPTDGNWSVVIQEVDSAHFFTGGIAKAVVGSTGAYNFSFTEGDATSGYAAILTFEEFTGMTAFQSDAFQADAFQIFGGVDATGNWKTTLGLAKASHKTVLGLAKASIKTFDGLTN